MPVGLLVRSAWTFYGRSYRTADPAKIADEMASIREPNVFIVDDVTFIHPEHGMAIADELEKRGVKKRYYLVATPYPGTELFHAETRELTSTDYRLYDIQHAVLPTKLPLHEFYAELVPRCGA